jgi:uroporphyrinogen decarboxylase
MTKRERVLKALEFVEPDFTPYHIGLTKPLREKVAAHFGTDDVDAALGNSLLQVSAEPPDAWREIRPGFWRDEFGVVWDRTIDEDIGTTCEYQLPEPTLARYNWPDPSSRARVAGYEKALRDTGELFVVANFGFTLFERAWTLRGMENLLVDMVINPEFVDELFDAICDWNVEVTRKMMELPFDAVLFGDDWGSQRGLIMGPALWRQFLRPRLERMYEVVRKAGRKVMIHSCGDVDELFDDLVEIGVNVFNPFQPEVMDTFELAARYKGSLAFFGGISTQRLLPYGTPDEVRAGVREIVRRIGKGGGYIAAPAHDTPKDVPLENILAMLEVLREKEPRG